MVTFLKGYFMNTERIYFCGAFKESYKTQRVVEQCCVPLSLCKAIYSFFFGCNIEVVSKSIPPLETQIYEASRNRSGSLHTFYVAKVDTTSLDESQVL